ncbi:zinc finger protein 723-like [Topomyia yanbarensis]|uniref:zinc finger protein 723-like n=1 Tax=Topomyia yanbarensis TaxID=2498891 RepID=UPI00273C8EE4|nr:zinc finger protein 723-like [Topomyia yanbarensis]XP_058835379.1 zinc finger protein 723-like [Topomyia yanbarensis]
MGEAFHIDNVPAHCLVCLKFIKYDQNTVHLSANRMFQDLYNEVLLESSLNTVTYANSYLCRSCCSKLEDVHQFRTRCTEVWRFYATLLEAKESPSEASLVKLVTEKYGHPLLSTLFEIGIISKPDMPTEEFLAEIGIVQTVRDTAEKPFFPIDVDAVKLEQQTTDDFDSLPEIAFVFESSDDESVEKDNGTNPPQNEPEVVRNANTDLPKNSNEKICPIEDCLESFAGKRYSDHLTESHGFSCRQCGLVIVSKHAMERHILGHTQQSLTVQCTFCERKFRSVAKMRAHAKIFHLKNPENYECEHCPERFESRKLLNEHIDQHLPKFCVICKTDFDDYKKLLVHSRKFHAEQLLKCHQCPRKFLLQSLLNRHLLEHTETTEIINNETAFDMITMKTTFLFACPECKKQYISDAHCKKHMVTHDPASYPNNVRYRRSKEELEKLEYKYKCDQCDASYRVLSSFKQHLKRHQTTSLVCDICGGVFKSKATLKTHITYKHTKDWRYACDFCPKSFATRSVLTRHRRIHTNERPYECDQCGARFKAHDAHRKHMRIHTREVKHHCDVCNRDFIWQSSWAMHKIVHTKEKPIQCIHCQRQFRTKGSCQKHILRVHPNLATEDSTLVSEVKE